MFTSLFINGLFLFITVVSNTSSSIDFGYIFTVPNRTYGIVTY